MSASLTRQALELPVEERIELIEQLWDSLIQEDRVPELTEAQRLELDARLDDLERNPTAGRPWREVRADIESRRRSGPFAESRSTRRDCSVHVAQTDAPLPLPVKHPS